ncbi:hypothetical protein V6N13_055432 [Hibiscus sabdariffa]
MGIIKPRFPLILCCFLLASLVFFPHGTVSQMPSPGAHCVAEVCRPGSPGGPGSRASETSHAPSQVNSATPKLEKQKAP